MSERQTDRQTRDGNGHLIGSGKTTRWSVTVYEPQWALMESMPPGIAWYGKQKEQCPKTGTIHLQGAMITNQQHRWSGCKGDYKVGASLRALIPGVHIEPASNWEALLQYCKKEDTRVPGSQFEAQTNSIPTHFQYAERVAQSIASNIPPDKKLHDLSKERLQQLIDDIVKQDIRSGKRYAAWIASNPQWKAMWKPYGREFILSYININAPRIQEAPGSQDAQGQTQGCGQETEQHEGCGEGSVSHDS